MTVGTHDISLPGPGSKEMRIEDWNNDIKFWEEDQLKNLAVIKLPMKLEYSEYVRPICMGLILVNAGDNVTIAGYGKYEGSKEVKRSATPRAINVMIRETETCKTKFGEKFDEK